MWWAEMTPDNVLAYLRDRDAKRLCGLAPVGEDGRPRVRMEPTLRQRAEQSLSRIRRSEAGKGHAEGRTVGAPPR